MNWGGAFLEKGPSPLPKPHPFSPKDFCKGRCRAGRLVVWPLSMRPPVFHQKEPPRNCSLKACRESFRAGIR